MYLGLRAFSVLRRVPRNFHSRAFYEEAQGKQEEEEDSNKLSSILTFLGISNRLMISICTYIHSPKRCVVEKSARADARKT